MRISDDKFPLSPMMLADAYEAARTRISHELQNAFFRENFYNMRESEANEMADTLLKVALLSLDSNGFVVSPKVAP